jgi:hypothetical protein
MRLYLFVCDCISCISTCMRLYWPVCVGICMYKNVFDCMTVFCLHPHVCDCIGMYLTYRPIVLACMCRYVYVCDCIYSYVIVFRVYPHVCDCIGLPFTLNSVGIPAVTRVGIPALSAGESCSRSVLTFCCI